MKILYALMRFYSYLFTLFLSVFLTGFGAVAYLSGLHNWKIDTFIWTGEDLSKAMLILGVLGGLSVLMAFFNIFRGLLPVMALIFFGLIVYGFFWQSYRFAEASGQFLRQAEDRHGIADILQEKRKRRAAGRSDDGVVNLGRHQPLGHGPDQVIFRIMSVGLRDGRSAADFKQDQRML